MPVAISRSITDVWHFGSVFCKLGAYLQGVAVATSVFTITAMSIDRYLAITQPIGFPKLLNRKSATIVIMILWVISLIIFLPLLWVYVQEDLYLPNTGYDKKDVSFRAPNNLTSEIESNFNETENTTMNVIYKNILYTQTPSDISDDFSKWVFCKESWRDDYILQRNAFGYICFVFMYAIPGFIMVVAYSLMGRTLCSVKPPFDINEGRSSTQQSARLVRERKRVAWILLLLAVLFAACWLPYNMLMLLVDIKSVSSADVMSLHPYALLLGHANSAINPLLYCFMTKNFRRSVKELIFHTRWRWTTHRRRQRQCQIRLIARFNTNKGTAQQRNGAIRSTSVDRALTMDAMYADHVRRESSYKNSGTITNVIENRRDSIGALTKTSSGYDSYHSMHQKIPTTPSSSSRQMSGTRTSVLKIDSSYSSTNMSQIMRLEVRKNVTVEMQQAPNSVKKVRKPIRLLSMFKKKDQKCRSDNDVFVSNMTDIHVRESSSGKSRKRVEFL